MIINIKMLSYHSFLERIKLLSSAGICSAINYSLGFNSNFVFFSLFYTPPCNFNLIFFICLTFNKNILIYFYFWPILPPPQPMKIKKNNPVILTLISSFEENYSD